MCERERQKREWELKIMGACLFCMQGQVSETKWMRRCYASMNFFFFSICRSDAEGHYYSQSNLTLMSHQYICDYVKYQLTGSLTRTLFQSY